MCAVLLLLLLHDSCVAAGGEGQLPAAVCTISIVGSGSEEQPDTIRSAAWECSTEAGLVAAAVHPVLRPFVPAFKGMHLDSRCATPGCLITFCGDSISTPAVDIRDSSLTDFTTTRIHSMLCAVNSSSLTLSHSTVSKNYARAVYGTDDADVNIHNSVITDNWCAWVQHGGHNPWGLHAVGCSGRHRARRAVDAGQRYTSSSMCLLSASPKVCRFLTGAGKQTAAA